MTAAAAHVMQLWRLLGGYHVERLPVVDLVVPVDDVELAVEGLAVMRDHLQEGL